MPINLVVFKGSYLIESVGYLIFGSASRLDAFSVYPILHVARLPRIEAAALDGVAGVVAEDADAVVQHSG